MKPLQFFDDLTVTVPSSGSVGISPVKMTLWEFGDDVHFSDFGRLMESGMYGGSLTNVEAIDTTTGLPLHFSIDGVNVLVSQRRPKDQKKGEDHHKLVLLLTEPPGAFLKKTFAGDGGLSFAEVEAFALDHNNAAEAEAEAVKASRTKRKLEEITDTSSSTGTVTTADSGSNVCRSASKAALSAADTRAVMGGEESDSRDEQSDSGSDSDDDRGGPRKIIFRDGWGKVLEVHNNART